MEKLKTLVDKWEIRLNINNLMNGEDVYTVGSFLGGFLRADLWHCHYALGNEHMWAEQVRRNAKQFNLLLVRPEDFERLEFHLKAVRSELLSIINECNCEEENNQQLVLRRSIENSLIIVKEENSHLQTQLAQRDKDIEWGKKELTKTQTERDDFKNKWVLTENEVRRITNLFNTLQLENTRKDEEINRVKNEIRNLKGELGQSREIYLNQKISLKEGKLETFIQQLGANRAKIVNLLNAYKQLLRARNDFNQDNIDVAENSINDIKQELLANGIIYRGISVDNTQKICSKCEKLAKLKLELNQVYQQQQQQLQAYQEQPINN